jgi:hypothetical protein
MSKFDINMTYHLEDAVPFTYYIDIDFYTKYWQHPILPKVCQLRNTAHITRTTHTMVHELY